MKRAFFIVATLFFACSAFCQKSVVATGGSATSLAGTKISYSVGQVAMGTAQTTNFSVNEGVQQPIAVSELSIEEAMRLAVELNVYPNPSSNTLNIARTDDVTSKLDYQLITSDGVVVLSGVLEGQTTAVSLQSLPAAVYLLRVTDGKQQRAYRIIKK
ncbi:MAG: T9SS type A sorting domain-containing protein [Bacteroidales bacterium]|nr:T9SS type A sorting domain-containing protein [Bacteroidales bacterium]